MVRIKQKEATAQRDAVGDLRENFAVAANDRDYSKNPENSERLGEVLPRVFAGFAKRSDAELIALDGVAEFARSMIDTTISLFEDACAADVVGVEAGLWRVRRILTAAINTWREAVPPPDEGDAK